MVNRKQNKSVPNLSHIFAVFRQTSYSSFNEYIKTPTVGPIFFNKEMFDKDASGSMELGRQKLNFIQRLKLKEICKFFKTTLLKTEVFDLNKDQSSRIKLATSTVFQILSPLLPTCQKCLLEV